MIALRTTVPARYAKRGTNAIHTSTILYAYRKEFATSVDVATVRSMPFHRTGRMRYECFLMSEDIDSRFRAYDTLLTRASP